MNNFEKIKYTFLHRKAFELVARQLLTGKDLEEMLKRAKTHDVDKMILYTVMNVEDAHNYHVIHASHHDNNIPKTYYDYLEMIIDWECAALTKPDKPLNAYDTLHKYYKNLINYILPILKDLNMDYSYSVKDKYPQINVTITFSEIFDEILVYIYNH